MKNFNEVYIEESTENPKIFLEQHAYGDLFSSYVYLASY